jgi:hypothetical protein
MPWPKFVPLWIKEWNLWEHRADPKRDISTVKWMILALDLFRTRAAIMCNVDMEAVSEEGQWRHWHFSICGKICTTVLLLPDHYRIFTRHVTILCPHVFWLRKITKNRVRGTQHSCSCYSNSITKDEPPATELWFRGGLTSMGVKLGLQYKGKNTDPWRLWKGCWGWT